MTTRTREQIRQEIYEVKQEIKRLEEKRIELLKESLLLSDDKQWYTEQTEDIPEYVIPEGKKRRKAVPVWHHTGRTHWIEEFKDGDTNESIFITRSRIVKMDGEWYTDAFGLKPWD